MAVELSLGERTKGAFIGCEYFGADGSGILD
jgi:hypothetical protein